MKAQLVTSEKSKLYGAKCGLCPRPVRVGESVLHKHMANDAYLETRLVFHTSCMAALVDRAPAGAALADALAEAETIRVEIRSSGSVYGAIAS